MMDPLDLLGAAVTETCHLETMRQLYQELREHAKVTQQLEEKFRRACQALYVQKQLTPTEVDIRELFLTESTNLGVTVSRSKQNYTVHCSIIDRFETCYNYHFTENAASAAAAESSPGGDIL